MKELSEEELVELFDGELIDEVELIDEKGKTVKFDHLMSFDYNDEFFIALLPIDNVEGINEDEVLILKIVEGENGEDSYVAITDMDYLDKVFDKFLTLLDELDIDDEE